ncbi:S41 family peptidase [bacterium]|nr:S41 family peptidase [candidate division CSSED10-310 bacterium]
MITAKRRISIKAMWAIATLVLMLLILAGMPAEGTETPAATDPTTAGQPAASGSTSGAGTTDGNRSMDTLHMVGRALSTVMQNPCTPLAPRDAVYAGIHGMFRTLDPYTQFLDETSFDYMRAQQQGSFYGIGISFDVRDGELLVVAPIEGSPAWELGIRAGDVIAEIEGESTAGITTNDVITQLRGEKGSTVRIGIRRKGESDLMHFDITREKIVLNSVRGGFFVAPGTGYIRLTEFSSTTYDELVTKLNELHRNGMERLIMDLRFNGGGLLVAAEQVSSLFLSRDQTIVSTRGRMDGSETVLRAREDGKYKELPLIVLVNESSASASEIVAGAIQDHDRGLVLGTETHGKGLVGSQFQTRLETAAQITTAQYFTPSGRFIQRPFNIPHRETILPMAQLKDNGRDIHATDTGRKVYGGGGITPDIIVEEPILSPVMFRLEADRSFFDFAVNRKLSLGSIDESFTVDDALLESFFAYVTEKYPELDPAKLQEESPTIRTAVQREMIGVYVNLDASDRIRVLELEGIKKALTIFPEIGSYLTPSSSGPDSSLSSLSSVSSGSSVPTP